MTNLEFIEKEIKSLKENIKFTKDIIKQNGKYPIIKKINGENLKSMEEQLTHLQQVKIDLEAWKVVKNHEFEIDRLDSVAEFYVVHVWKPLKPDELFIVKKALEVENVKN